ncbi:MAG TPA: hypothetical protein IAB97_04350 [Candidatus Choladousia intestinipullorum]|nr:hypothetical protein [Candidatus Choladousia intestinipullorum]
MPEYRRFIAYFYEYINGKKQKNAGFAKVELRMGMWRVLFRLTTDTVPGAPVRVYGFVRKEGYLLGIPLGAMQAEREAAEEWAYRADVPVAKGCRFEDFAGIWVRSADERCFLTVWDEEAVDVEKLVLEIPGQEERGLEQPEQPAQLPEEEPEAEAGTETIDRRTDQAGENGGSDAKQEKNSSSDAKPEQRGGQDAAREESGRESVVGYELGDDAEKKAKSGRDVVQELLGKRQRFWPVQNDELGSCVMIMPCDIVRMQQEGWQVGRSSFLQHGFYQHRHLLLGMKRDGTYLLGVPGMRTPQEQYMAELFGFPDFMISRVCECRKVFGYWCRPLQMRNT